MEASEKVRVYDKGVDRAGEIVSYGDSLTVRSGDILIPKISLQEPLRIECQHFVDCVRTRKPPLTDGESGLRVVKVLAAAQASLEAGGAPIAIAPERAGVS
jgi:predicted dehydrogenase